MDELIERIEKAEAGSRELDIETALLIDWRWPEWDDAEPTPRRQAQIMRKDAFIERVCHPDYCGAWVGIPRFTTSIDAAMTLVPEGWATFQYTQGPSGKPHLWDLWRIRDGERFYTHASAKASTPALALCAAALRARKETDNGQ